MATTAAGPALLVVVAVGMLALVLWHAAEAAFGYGRVAQHHDEKRRLRKRLSSAGRTVVYLLIGISAARLVLGRPVGGGARRTA
jgi:hypothetical protein